MGGRLFNRLVNSNAECPVYPRACYTFCLFLHRVANMLGASFLPARFRGADSQNVPSRPSYLNKKLSPLLQSLSRRSCTHPIHTIVFVALLASTSYIGLLEGSLFESGRSTANASQGVDLASLQDGRRHLKVGQETGWKWQPESRDVADFDNVSCVPQPSCSSSNGSTVCRTPGIADPCISKLTLDQLSSDCPSGRRSARSE